MERKYQQNDLGSLRSFTLENYWLLLLRIIESATAPSLLVEMGISPLWGGGGQPKLSTEPKRTARPKHGSVWHMGKVRSATHCLPQLINNHKFVIARRRKLRYLDVGNLH